MVSEPKKVGRRTFLNYAIAVVATGVIVGAATYFAVPKGVTTVTAPGATTTVTAPGATVTTTKTVTTTATQTTMQYPRTKEALAALRNKHLTSLKNRLLEAAKASSVDWKQFSGQTINLSYRTGPEQAVLQDVAKMFTDLTGIKVNIDITPENDQITKATADVLQETGIYDCPWLDLYRASVYVKPKKLEPLEQYYEDPKLTDKDFMKWNGTDIYPAIWEACNCPPWGEKGMHYFVPLYWHTQGLNFRKDLFDEYGLSLKDIDSYEDVLATAQKLNHPEKGYYGFAGRGAVGDSMNMFSMTSIFNAYGVKILDENYKPAFNNDSGVTALDLYVKLMTKYAPPGAVNWTFNDTLSATTTGKLAMCQDVTIWCYLAWDPEFTAADSPAFCNVWVNRIPKGPAGRFACMSGWTYAIPRGAKNKKAAWLWAEFSGSPLGVALFDAAKFPEYPRPALWDDPDIAPLIPPANVKETKMITFEQDSHWGDLLSNWLPEGSEVMYILSQAVSSALSGQMTPKEALAWAEPKVADIMKKYGYLK